jgi:hypothetical protein
MKACLMKVNYSPAYTTPHKNGSFDNYKGRLNQTKEIYGTSERQLRQTLEEAAAQKRTKLKAVLRDNSLGENEKVPVPPPAPEQAFNTSPSRSKKSVSITHMLHSLLPSAVCQLHLRYYYFFKPAILKKTFA